MRVAYLGSGPFAVPTFSRLLAEHAAGQLELVGLITQPDRTGRGHHRHVNPLKQSAAEAGVCVLQPENINDPASAGEVEALGADILLTASYGQYLGKRVRAAATHGAINLHGSILPKYRGAAPIQHTVWNRERETGVSVFQIEKGMDTGPVFHVARCAVNESDTSGDLFGRLANLAADAAMTVLRQLSDGTASAVPQDDAAATHAPKLTKADGLIDWSQPAERVRGQILATQPWPKPTTELIAHDGTQRRLLVLDAVPVPLDGEPGTLSHAGSELFVACGENGLRIERLQVAGKPAVDAAAFLNGYDVRTGSRFAMPGEIA